MPHGAANAILLPYVIELVMQLAADVGIPHRLAGLGLSEEPIQHLARNAPQDAC